MPSGRPRVLRASVQSGEADTPVGTLRMMKCLECAGPVDSPEDAAELRWARYRPNGGDLIDVPGFAQGVVHLRCMDLLEDRMDAAWGTTVLGWVHPDR